MAFPSKRVVFRPPRKDRNGQYDLGEFSRWLDQVWLIMKELLNGDLIPWSLVDKTDSDLADLETRKHSDLTNTSDENSHPSYAISIGVINKTTDYTLTATDDTICGDPTTADITLTLPPSATTQVGKTYDILHCGTANTVKVSGVNGYTPTLDIIFPGDSITVRNTGTDWRLK